MKRGYRKVPIRKVPEGISCPFGAFFIFIIHKMLPPNPPSSPITDLNGPSMVEKVEGGHTCRKKLPRRRDGRMRPVAGAAEMGAVGRFRGGGYFMR